MTFSCTIDVGAPAYRDTEFGHPRDGARRILPAFDGLSAHWESSLVDASAVWAGFAGLGCRRTVVADRNPDQCEPDLRISLAGTLGGSFLACQTERPRSASRTCWLSPRSVLAVSASRSCWWSC